MECSEILLFLSGLISISVVTFILFFVPLLLFGIYRNVKKTKELVEKILNEIQTANSFTEGGKEEETPEATNETKLCELFLKSLSDENGNSEIEKIKLEDEQ